MHYFFEVSNITKTFGSKRALKNISMNLRKGELISVVGHNGSGKTTLFKVLLDIYHANNGTVKFYENNFDLKNDVGYLPEQRGLYNKTTIITQLLAFGYLKGKSKKELLPKIDVWLSYFGLNEHKNDILGSLSKGNQQKIQFITSILHEPKLLILDEPFSGLDPINVDLFINAIKDLKDKGVSILYSSHQLNTVENLSDRLLMINKGEVVHFDTVDRIKDKYTYKLKIINDSLTEEILQSAGVIYELKDNVYEIALKDKQDSQQIVDLLPNKFSEMFIIEKPNLENIFKNVFSEKGERNAQ
ncbi:ABC transporter ATP-binding protein [Jeotgalibacillus marinus]|uniref:ATP-binding cassette domain-containing protein n=1 Tax=Jeotgalibacillus marinus TaxID=86667 RepID=A0ABV3Q308_9BACL